MKIEVSNGELVDRYTILTIKLNRLIDESKRSIVLREFDELKWSVLEISSEEYDIQSDINELLTINELLWDIENNIRRHEQLQDFGPAFIVLARQVYKTNDIRAEIKRRINEKTGSQFMEVKEHKFNI